MNVNEVMNNVRNPKVKLKRISEIKRYYLSLYRCYMLRLYDMDYIADPTKFDERVIRAYIIENSISSMISPVTGDVRLKSSQALFAYDKYKCKCEDDDYKEIVQFLYNLYKALKYRELSLSIDKIYEDFGFSESDSNKIFTKMTVKGAYYCQKSKLVFDEAMARCVSSFDEVTKCISIKYKLWDLACSELGIPVEDRVKDGIFDKDLSHADEIANMEGILNGFYEVEGGLYTDDLVKWLYEHKWSENKYSINQKGLYDYLYTNSSEIYNILNSELENKLADKEVLAIEGDKIYYNEKRTSFEMPFGVFAVICGSDMEEDVIDVGPMSLYGYTGELYSLSRINEDELDYVGCPISIAKNLSNTEYFYDVEQVDVYTTWFSSEKDINISFGECEFPKNSIFEEGTLQKEIYDDFILSQENSEYLISYIEYESSSDLFKAIKDVFKYLGKVVG